MISHEEIGRRISQRRQELGLTLAQVADDVGVAASTIQRYEKGSFEKIKMPVIEAISSALSINPAYLVGKTDDPAVTQASLPDNIIPMPKMRKVPLLGTIACGEPILAAENLDGEVDIPEHIHADFALRCKGDSMINARIFDGDIVYIRLQEDVENGEIAAVLIGDEATLKRVYKYPNRLELRPENPTYPVLQYEGEELEEIRIIGKAVAFTSAVR